MALPEHSTYDYKVDRSDSIEYVSDAWIDFARENGAEDLTRDAVVGQSLWDFISGSDTRRFYRAVFHRVRSAGIEVVLPFRCDSPETFRHMELRLRPGSESSLELSGRLLRQVRRTYVPLIDRLLTSAGQSFVLCGLCRRVLAFGEWVQPEEALQRFHVFETVHEPQLTHGICDRCERITAEAERKSDRTGSAD